MRQPVLSLTAVLACSLLVGSPCPAAPTAGAGGGPPRLPVAGLEWIGMAAIPGDAVFADEPVGGLSGLAWDAASGSFWALSDDPSDRAPARFYRLQVDLGDGRLDAGDVTIAERVTLRRADGTPFPPRSLDPEGLALAAGRLFVSSEGEALTALAPFVAAAERDGKIRRELPLPTWYRPGPGPVGVRQNLGFESLSLSPDGELLFAASENALAQDGPAAGLGTSSPARILIWRLADESAPPRELVYVVDPVLDSATPATPPGDGAFRLNGLVDLLALSPTELLAMERQYVEGQGHGIRLFRIDLTGATEVGGMARLGAVEQDLRPLSQRAPATSAAGDGSREIVPVLKELLLDLAELGDLGAPLGNVEAMALGPALPDGRRVLLLCADQNFDATLSTQLFAFAVTTEPLSTAAIQGAGHRSPHTDRWALDVAGVVTATISTRRSRGFWLESIAPDDDPATSEGIWVEWPPASATPATPTSRPAAPAPTVAAVGSPSTAAGRPGATSASATSAATATAGPAPPRVVAVGDLVRVHGRVREAAADPRQLTLTTLVASAVMPLPATPAELPAPVRLVSERAIPVTVIDDDELMIFEPATDAIDFWESLEGMRVELPGGVVAGPTTGYDELTLLPDGQESGGGEAAEAPAPAALRRTTSGALRVGPDGAPPVTVAVSGRLAKLPQADVGARVDGPVAGVVHYDFSRYKLVATAPLRLTNPIAPTCVEGAPRLVAAPGRPTIATFNVENLTAAGPPERFDELGRVIAKRMGGPTVVALEEIQDDSGPTDDGTVSSQATLDALIAGVVAHGGPRYQAVWIDPELNREGGQPGGNIRVALLIDPTRASLPRRGGTVGPHTAATVASANGHPQLAANPGRVAPDAEAFTMKSGEGVRRSLAVELELDGVPVFLAVNHWSSKWDDDRAWGARQPPVRPTAAKRLAQARVLRGWVEEILAIDPEARVVVLGDLNEGDQAPGIQHLAAPPLINLVATLPDADRYTYNFEGGAEAIDHIVVSPSLAGEAEIESIHLDSDCAEERRVSDHDPVVARLRLR